MSKTIVRNLPKPHNYAALAQYYEDRLANHMGPSFVDLPLQTNGKNGARKFMSQMRDGSIDIHFKSSGATASDKAQLVLKVKPNEEIQVFSAFDSNVTELQNHFIKHLTQHAVQRFHSGVMINKNMASEHFTDRAKKEMGELYRKANVLMFACDPIFSVYNDGDGYGVTRVRNTYNRVHDRSGAALAMRPFKQMFKALKIYEKLPMTRDTANEHLSNFNRHYQSTEMPSPLKAVVKYPDNRDLWVYLAATFHHTLLSDPIRPGAEPEFVFDMKEAKKQLRQAAAINTGAITKERNPFGHISRRFSLQPDVS